MKIILAGPPQSGKSCLRDRLSRAIRKQCPAGQDHLGYVITANPDGEGSWYAETYNTYPELATTLKHSTKAPFTNKAANIYAQWVQNCELPLTFVDIGGKITEQNRRICKAATHAILVYGDKSKLEEWRQFCQELKITIIAEIFSDLYGQSDKPLTCFEDGVHRGSIHNLERGIMDIGPVEEALANLLLTMCPEQLSSIEKSGKPLFKMELQGNRLIVGFGEPAQHDVLIPTVSSMLDKLLDDHGIKKMELIKIDGKISNILIALLTIKLATVCKNIAVFDPKLNGYMIIKNSVDKTYTLGQVLT